MKHFIYIAILVVLCTACNNNSPEQKGTVVTYTETDELFPNPERGLLSQIYYVSDDLESHASANTINNNRSSISYLTLYLHSYYLTDYMESDIAQAFLDRLETNMNALREGGGKVFERDSDFAQELFSQTKEGVSHEEMEAMLKKIDEQAKQINLLENKSEIAEGINIIGVNDIKTAHISAQEFTNILNSEIKPNTFNLLLTHTPLYFKEAAKAGVNLMLSGHTHKGQIWPFNFVVKAFFPYFNGQYSEGNANLF